MILNYKKNKNKKFYLKKQLKHYNKIKKIKKSY